MSEPLNNQTFLQIIEALSRNKPDELDQCMSANLVDRNPIPGQAPGLPGFKQWMNMARSAFPDLHATIEWLDASPGMVPHRAASRGIEPTGKKIAFAAIHIVRFEDGKAVEWWGIFRAQSNNYNRYLEKVIPSSDIRKLDYQCYPQNTQRTCRP